jgi:hypothetical protein
VEQPDRNRGARGGGQHRLGGLVVAVVDEEDLAAERDQGGDQAIQQGDHVA